MSLICIFLVVHFLNFSKYAKISIKKIKNEELVMLLKLIYFELV